MTLKTVGNPGYNQIRNAPARPLGQPSILFVGDSTVSQNDSTTAQTTGTASVAITRGLKAIGWLDALTMGGFGYDTTVNPLDGYRYGSNAGFGGDGFVEVLAKLVTGDQYTGNAPLLSRPETYVWVQCGTNDINAGQSFATLQTNATAVMNAIVNAGKYPIMCTVLPRNSVDGANDWSATVTTQAQKRLVLQNFNRWLEDYCRDKGYRCIAWHNAVTNTAGQLTTGYSTDGLHPSQQGGYYLAREALRQLNGILPVSSGGQVSAYDVYDATYNPYGSWLNGDFSITTGGAINDAGGTGTLPLATAVPDNWQLSKSTSTTTSCALAIVARPDGQPGNALRLTWTSAGTGSASEDWRLSYWSGSNTTLASFLTTAGEICSMECEFSVASGHGGVFKGPQVRLGENSAIAYTASTISFNGTNNTINDSANGFVTALFEPNRLINVSGSASNNKTFVITGVTAGTLTVSPTAAPPRSNSVTTESAGASITVRLPSYAWVTSTSTETFPDANTGTFLHRIPTCITNRAVNASPRLGFFINGTIAGTAVVHIMRPMLYKRYAAPPVNAYRASDN